MILQGAYRGLLQQQLKHGPLPTLSSVSFSAISAHCSIYIYNKDPIVSPGQKWVENTRPDCPGFCRDNSSGRSHKRSCGACLRRCAKRLPIPTSEELEVWESFGAEACPQPHQFSQLTAHPTGNRLEYTRTPDWSTYGPERGVQGPVPKAVLEEDVELLLNEPRNCHPAETK